MRQGVDTTIYSRAYRRELRTDLLGGDGTRDGQHFWIAMATERSDNPGPSITNAAEDVLAYLRERMAIPDDADLWYFERYPQTQEVAETIDRMWLVDGVPCWRPATGEELSLLAHVRFIDGIVVTKTDVDAQGNLVTREDLCAGHPRSGRQGPTGQHGGRAMNPQELQRAINLSKCADLCAMNSREHTEALVDAMEAREPSSAEISGALAKAEAEAVLLVGTLREFREAMGL